ncbi:MAG TPA: colicin D domain-containing protein [Chthonomonadales bacterium]|nr:colicin D domain-containing protein [Chthonomonadales bacterium]
MLLGLRYYDPSVGRFINRDPIDYDGGVNLYAYLHDNPINGADPRGTQGSILQRIFSKRTLGDVLAGVAGEIIDPVGGGAVGVGIFEGLYDKAEGHSTRHALVHGAVAGALTYVGGRAVRAAGRAIAGSAIGQRTAGMAAALTRRLVSVEAQPIVVRIGVGTLQHEFKHAAQFGIEGDWSKSTAELFQEAIEQHIANAPVRIAGTFRGTIPVTHYFDAETGLWAAVDRNGFLRAAWKLSPKQVKFLLSVPNVR